MTRSLDEINRHYRDILEDGYALVPGEGNAHATLLLVGEAPGAQEAQLGRPFVGKAGQQLDAFLAGVSLRREALYITNAVKFRPTKQGTRGPVNRTPTPAEVALFRPWLLEELATVSPSVVATLGNTALRAVTGGKEVIGNVHGAPLSLDAPYVLFPLYHPASVIYRRELAETYATDIERLRDYMARL